MAPQTAGGRFPCEGGQCGCRSAHDCWSGCCCLTPAQRLAWAKANDVTPPAELAQLAASSTDAEPVAANGKPRGKALAACCTGAASRSCCQKSDGKKQEEQSACCARGGREMASTCKTTAETVTEETTESSSSPAMERRHCRGLSFWWVAGGQPLALPERPVALRPGDFADSVVMTVVCYACDAESPPTRPG